MRREVEDLRARQQRLEQKMTETRAEVTAQKTASPPEASPRFELNRQKGACVSGGSGTEICFRLVLQFDGRAYFADTQPIPDTFLLRRARPFVEGSLWGIIGFRLMPDVGQGQAVVQDAYIELRPWRWLRLRGGRFKAPLGLEWLQSDSMMPLVERSLATSLVPFRTLGVMLLGEIAEGIFSYQIAMVGGAPDGGNGPDFDPQSDKELIGHLFFRPLRLARIGELLDLGLGMAASYGERKGAPAANLAPYRSPGQQAIFTFLNDPAAPPTTLEAAGTRWRAAPHFYWYSGPFGLLAEYVMSSQRLSRMSTAADLRNRGWSLTLSFMLTLERAAYEGVVPRRPIDFQTRGFGAFELTMRYSELHFDSSAYPVFADPSASVRSARELTGGLNWYLTDYARIMLSLQHVSFTGGAPQGDRIPEYGLFGRLQLAL
jgi:phosphate-selective porin OprO/OprP